MYVVNLLFNAKNGGVIYITVCVTCIDMLSVMVLEAAKIVLCFSSDLFAKTYYL